MNRRKMRGRLLSDSFVFLALLTLFVLGLSAVITNFHSYNYVQKIFLPFGLAVIFLFLTFKVFILFCDVESALFPPKSIFVVGSIEVWKIESLKRCFIERGWVVLNDEDSTDLRVTLMETKGKNNISCRMKDKQGREKTVKLSDIFWPNEAVAIIQEFVENTQR